MFVFSLTFPDLWKSIFPSFGVCMDFCFAQNIWETHKFRMLVFSHTFPVLRKSTFLMFWELYGYLPYPKYLRDHKFEMFMFSHTFPIWKSTFLVFWGLGILWVSASRKICKKHLSLKCSVFSYFFPMFWGQYYWCEE